VGPSAAADLALTGRTIDADAALRTGLVSRTSEEPATVAREIADHESIPVRATATRLRTGWSPGSDDATLSTLEAKEREAFTALVRRHKG
jgi:enoyl-CoA hydratase/carnithine racemase